jgi:cell division protein FtsI (penicillin-binding protein 3)
MPNAKIENKMIHYRSAILLMMFLTIFFLFMIFLSTIIGIINSDRKTDNKFITIENKAIRGKIISKDNFVVSFSQKQFRAEVNTRSIDPRKKDLFVKLFSIYSGIPEKEILSKFISKKGRTIKGRIVLCDNIDVRLSSDLKSLSHKMSSLGIFRPLNPRRPHLVYGLDILPASETRYFPHKNLLTPVVGYMRRISDNGYEIPVGIKGIEKSYQDFLEPSKNGFIRGKRDILGTVLRDGQTHEVERVDGMDIHLNINLDFQRSVEMVLDEMKNQIGAEEIMVAVMESKTGKLLSLASSERFDPKHIVQKDVNSLNPNFSEYLYEPGSVMKPLTLAIAMDNNKVDLRKKIRLGGKLKVTKNYTISDDDYFKSLTPQGILMHSSNIGIAKIAWKLTGEELYNGWLKFGLSQPSGIDLSKELAGKIKPPYLLNYKVHSANMAYGYGMLANFMQMIKAYSAFNNNGLAMTPRLVDYLSIGNKKYDTVDDVPNLEACSPYTASKINSMLIATVSKGTGRSAQYDGLTVGGKTGTAHINYKGHYVEKYHSSFYGFVNDKLGHKYTVGVFVIKPKKVYFASQTAAPTFKKVVNKMVKHHYLIVDRDLAKIHFAQREAVRKRRHDAYVRKIQAYNKAHGIE